MAHRFSKFGFSDAAHFEGPIGFINFKLPKPTDYLERTIKRWKELCQEVGLYELERRK